MFSYYVEEAHRNLSEGNMEEAILSLETAVKNMEFIDLDVITHLGFLYFETQQYSRAKSIFNKVTNLDPEYVEAYYGLGGVAEEEGNLSRAIDYYLLTLKFDKEHEFANFNLAGIYADMPGKELTAIKHYKKIIMKNKEHFWAHLNIGNVYEKLNKNKEAYKYFLKAYEIDPRNEKALFNLGVGAFKLKNYEDAITWYKESLLCDEQYEYSYLNLALLYKDIYNDDQKALDTYNEGLNRFPDNSILMYNRACIHAIMKNNEESIRDLKTSFLLDETLKEFCTEDEELVEVLQSEEIKRLLEE